MFHWIPIFFSCLSRQYYFSKISLQSSSLEPPTERWISGTARSILRIFIMLFWIIPTCTISVLRKKCRKAQPTVVLSALFHIFIRYHLLTPIPSGQRQHLTAILWYLSLSNSSSILYTIFHLLLSNVSKCSVTVIAAVSLILETNLSNSMYWVYTQLWYSPQLSELGPSSSPSVLSITALCAAVPVTPASLSFHSTEIFLSSCICLALTDHEKNIFMY